MKIFIIKNTKKVCLSAFFPLALFNLGFAEKYVLNCKNLIKDKKQRINYWEKNSFGQL